MPAAKNTAVDVAKKLDVSIAVVPPSEGSKPENRYHFKASDRANAKVYSVPFIQYLSGEGNEYLETVAEKPLSEATLLRNMIRIECPEAYDEVRKMSNDQVSWISQEWAKASTASVGESSASDDS